MGRTITHLSIFRYNNTVWEYFGSTTNISIKKRRKQLHKTKREKLTKLPNNNDYIFNNFSYINFCFDWIFIVANISDSGNCIYNNSIDKSKQRRNI